MQAHARIVLLRHGEAESDGRCYGRRVDPPLSTRGIIEVRRASERLDLTHVERVVASPAARAQASLAHLQASGVLDERDADTDDRWSERDFGDWEGRPWDELWAQTPVEVQRDPAAYVAFTPPGGETWDEVAGRVVAAYDELAGAGGTTLVVTHAGPIRALLAERAGLTPAATFAFALEHGRAVQLAVVGGHTIVEGVGW